MQFRLTYEGTLRSSQSRKPARHKHDVRKRFHPQLKYLWNTHPLLSNRRLGVGYDQLSDRVFQGAFSWGLGKDEGKTLKEVISEHDDFSMDNYTFVPLLCKKFCLHCSLDILFLRNGPLSAIQNSDLDNRTKTLVDALRMPKPGELKSVHEEPANGETPFFCLLEDDSFITSLAVKNDTLLLPEKDDKNFAKIVINVNIQPLYATTFNLGF